jgi:hypothetical protein
MMLEVPRPLPLGMAARVVSSTPPPKSFNISLSVPAFRGQAAESGENPDITRAALARANRLDGCL